MSDLGLGTALYDVEAYAARFPGNFPVSTGTPRPASAPGRTVGRCASSTSNGTGQSPGIFRSSEVLNAVNSQVLEQLEQTLSALAEVPELRVVTWPKSPVFATGADIAEMVGKDIAGGRAFGFPGQAVCKRIEEFRTPVIALHVEGYALGGGLELALASISSWQPPGPDRPARGEDRYPPR